jgi:hypothetical protein
VFLCRPFGESPALKQEAFATMLLDWLTTLEKSGTVLFDLYEELEIDGSMPDALQTGTSRSTGPCSMVLNLSIQTLLH